MKSSFHHLIWFWLPPLGHMTANIFASSMPDPQIGGNTPDYVLHALAYFLLTLLLIRLLLTLHPVKLLKITASIGFYWKNKSQYFNFWHSASISGAIIAIVFGITDEIHQYYTPGRHCSFQDVLANSFGSFTAYGIAMLDRLVFTGQHFQRKWIEKISWLRVISYAAHLSEKKSDRRLAF